MAGIQADLRCLYTHVVDSTWPKQADLHNLMFGPGSTPNLGWHTCWNAE